MKKIFLLGIAFCFIASLAFAETPAAVETLTGDIIDNMCAGAQKPEALADFVKTHTKQCALSPDCQVSGYSILADGKLTKFDAASSAKIAEFLKKEDSKLQVAVTANRSGEELNVVSVENQK